MKNKVIEYKDHAVMVITRRNGDTFRVKFDLEMLPKLKDFKYKWFIRHNKAEDNYYASATVYEGMNNGKASYSAMYFHRFVTNAPKGLVVDHINHDTLDNRLCNLRFADMSKNAFNRKGANSNSKTGVRNVVYRYNKFVVQFQINGKNTVVAQFDTLDEAREFAEKNRPKYYGNVG